MNLKPLAILALGAALFLPPKAANADINLFPPAPVNNILMADSGEYQSRIKFPAGLDGKVFQDPLNEIAPYISLAKTLPLISFDWRMNNPENFKIFMQHVPEDKVKRELKRVKEGKDITDKLFSLYFVGSGLFDFPSDSSGKGNGTLEYKGKLEAFLTSPMINEYFSDGNRFYLAGGVEARGLVDLGRIKSISSIGDFPPTDYSAFGNVYLVVNSPWSEQFLITKVGVGGLNKDEKTFNFSTTFEFPSIFGQENGLKNFKLAPYLSFYAELPFTKGRVTTAAGEAGLRLAGETEGRSVVLYGRAEMDNGNLKDFSAGVKWDL